MVDEKLLKPSREHLAHLRAEIKRLEAQTVADIERYCYGDKECARQRWHKYHLAVEPLRREQEAVTKVIADYYGIQTQPPVIILDQQLRTDDA